ncbi:MAG: leucine-rich repeat protein [Bacteroidales bacterium]|nr:leucine-rich repeat protein [Candidatus Sodaliphilus fimicaballi]
MIPNTIDKNGKTYTVTAIAENAFKDCAAITAITIPEGVTSIGDYAFAGCTGITTVNYNAVNAEYSHIETVWNDYGTDFYIDFDSQYIWFKDCRLTNLNIGNNVKHIPAGLAYNQTGLTSIVIPESVISIADYAFFGCTGVSSLTYNAPSVRYIHYDTYMDIAQPDYAWFRDFKLTSLTIGESVKTIPVALAYGQKLLTSIEIPSGVTIIDSYAFDGCSNLTEINIPKSVEYIYDGVFRNTGITSLTIPESVQVIYRTALSNMPNLKKLTVNTDASWSMRMGDDPELPVLSGSPIEELVLGKNVKVIPGKFNYCEPYGCTGESLKKITIFATTPPEIELGYYGGAEPFGYFESELYIPKGTYDDYKNSYWGNFMNMYMIDEEGNVLASEIQLNCYYDEYYGGYLVDLEDTRSTTVKATVFPEIAANKNVIWSSSNPYEASVDENGVITAHSWGGECTITATAADGGGASASITVRTHPLIVSSISIDQQDISIVEGESAQLTVSFDPIEATNKYCRWSSSDNKVATVNYDGVVTAHSLGTAIITAKSDDGPMATTTITVTPAANHLAVPAELTCGMGETVELKIELNNEAEIAAFQFDLDIPQGFVLAKNYKGKDDITLSRGQGHTLMYNNGRVMAYSVSTAPFTGHSGVILKVRLVATPDVKDGQQYTVGYRNIVLTESNGKTYTTADIKTVITTENHVLLGDVDSDGVVDVADVLLTANKAIGNFVEDFAFEAGDVNKDATINVTDVVLVANIALGKDINIAAAPRMGESVDNMFFNEFTLKRGEEKTVSVSLDNTFGFAAFQMNLNLPYGVELVKARLTGRADGHSIMTNKKLDGSVTMLAYNLASSNFNGNEGALLELTLKADDSFAGYGDFVLSNITLAESNGHSREVSDVVSTVSVVTGVSDIYSEVRVYTVDNVIVIETPDAGDAQIICANGMNRTIKVNAGRNTYTVVENGVYIVRVGGKAVKVVI